MSAVAVFDAALDGTAEEAWAAWAPLTGAPELTTDGMQHLVVVAAHPDDETLGAGGLVATAAALGVSTDVVVATAGEASHPRSPTHSPEVLAVVRRREVTAAVARLSPSARLHLLDLPDGALADHAHEVAAAVQRLAAPGPSTWLVAPWREDRHPDHEAVGAAAAGVAARSGASLLEHPVWAWHWARPEGGDLPAGRLRRLVLSPRAAAAKRAALAEHVSQVAALSAAEGDEALLRPSFAAHFERPYETFLVARG